MCACVFGPVDDDLIHYRAIMMYFWPVLFNKCTSCRQCWRGKKEGNQDEEYTPGLFLESWRLLTAQAPSDPSFQGPFPTSLGYARDPVMLPLQSFAFVIRMAYVA